MEHQSSLAARVNHAIDQAIGDRRIVGTVVLVAQRGEVVLRRAAGLADREANIAMREDAIFRLASITKPIVTAATMRYHERGKLDLHAPVTDWLPGFRPALSDGSRPTITLHQLLTHTAGLGYRFLETPGGIYAALDISDGLDQPGLTLAENLDRLADAPLLFAPGSAWHYSLGLDVAGAVLEAVAGKPLGEIVDDEVTRSLALADTGFGTTERSRLVVPYAAGEKQPKRMEGTTAVPLYDGAALFSPDRILDSRSYHSGGAGMAGTAGEVLSFLMALQSGRVVASDTFTLMAQDHVGAQAQTQGPGWGFGYGWAVLEDPDLAQTPQGRGTLKWGGAYGHSWFIDPVAQMTVVALTNTAFEGMNGQFVTDIRDAVYGPA